MSLSEDWKRAIVAARVEDAVKITFANEVFPPAGSGGYDSLPRALRTPFIDAWNQRPDEVKAEAGRLRDELLAAMREGRGHELAPFTGQSAGMIHDILPVDEILRTIIAEAKEALQRAASI